MVKCTSCWWTNLRYDICLFNKLCVRINVFPKTNHFVIRLFQMFVFFTIATTLFAENLRVMNGSNRCNGRVEVYLDGHWKRACSSDWGKEESTVVCNEIGCGTPVMQTVAPHFGQSTSLSGVKTACAGNETSISNCTFQDFKETCIDATVFCSSK